MHAFEIEQEEEETAALSLSFSCKVQWNLDIQYTVANFMAKASCTEMGDTSLGLYQSSTVGGEHAILYLVS